MIIQIEITEKSQDLEAIIQEAFFSLEPGKWEMEIRKPKRTIPQNSSIHKFCTQVAAELSGKGITFKSLSIINGKEIEQDWTMELVKNQIWRPTQISLLDKESTTQLNTSEVDKVAEPIIKLLAQQFGIGVEFPSKFHIS